MCDQSGEPYCKNGAVCIKDRASPCVCADLYSGDRCDIRAGWFTSFEEYIITSNTVLSSLSYKLKCSLIETKKLNEYLISNLPGIPEIEWPNLHYKKLYVCLEALHDKIIIDHI